MTSDKSQSRAPIDVPEPPDETLSDETQCVAETGKEIVANASVVAQQWVGKQLGKYQVTEVIGWGGMGFVLKAHDPTLETYPDSRTAADWKAYLHDLYTGWGDQWIAPPKD